MNLVKDILCFHWLKWDIKIWHLVSPFWVACFLSQSTASFFNSSISSFIRLKYSDPFCWNFEYVNWIPSGLWANHANRKANMGIEKNLSYAFLLYLYMVSRTRAKSTCDSDRKASSLLCLWEWTTAINIPMNSYLVFWGSLLSKDSKCLTANECKRLVIADFFFCSIQTF